MAAPRWSGAGAAASSGPARPGGPRARSPRETAARSPRPAGRPEGAGAGRGPRLSGSAARPEPGLPEETAASFPRQRVADVVCKSAAGQSRSVPWAPALCVLRLVPSAVEGEVAMLSRKLKVSQNKAVL